MKNVTMIEGADAAIIAAWLGEYLSTAQRGQEGKYAITMPGGSTPFPIIKELLVIDGVAWDRIEVWPNDDRIVPEDHDASNTGKMRTLIEPALATITALVEDSTPPHFALTWLGMGPDGHTASLFPNTDPQIDDQKLVRRLTPDPLPSHAPFDRITLTLPALLNADSIIFTLGGSTEKRAVFEQAMSGEHDLPVARLLKTAYMRGIPVTCFT